MLKKLAIVLSVAALSATVACSKTDSGVTHSVKAKIADDAATKGSDISVDTGQKTVTLNGTVASNEQKARADQLAQDTKGVKDVVNDIAVNPKAAGTSGSYDDRAATTATDKAGVALEDSAITTDIKTKFLAESGVPGTDIHVETTKGVVTLSGNVKSRAQEDKAMAIARGSKGVKRVVNRMKVAA